MEERLEENRHVSCTCVPVSRTIPFSEKTTKDLFKMYRSKTFYFDDGQQLLKCHNCYAEAQMCFHPITDTSLVCLKKHLIIRDAKSFINLKESGYEHLTISDNKSSIDLKEQGHACYHPEKLETAEITCDEYPNYIFCRQKCIYGHTLPEGIHREMMCMYKENKWHPKGFQECQPFVDCTMRLISSGKYTCSAAGVNIPPECIITCYSNGNTPEIREKSYCLINGEWSEELPFCVGNGSGLKLAPAPKVKLHPYEEDYEKYEKMT